MNLDPNKIPTNAEVQALIAIWNRLLIDHPDNPRTLEAWVDILALIHRDIETITWHRKELAATLRPLLIQVQEQQAGFRRKIEARDAQKGAPKVKVKDRRDPRLEWEHLRTMRDTNLGQIQLVRHVRTGEVAVAKLSNKAKIKASHSSEDPLAEVAILRHIRADSPDAHPNIIRLIDAYPHGDPQFHWTILELAQLGDFFSYVEAQIAPRVAENPKALGGLPSAQARHFFKQIVDSVAYLRSCGLVHLDLKLENLLVQHDPTTNRDIIKLTDFGVVKSIYDRRRGVCPDCSRSERACRCSVCGVCPVFEHAFAPSSDSGSSAASPEPLAPQRQGAADSRGADSSAAAQSNSHSHSHTNSASEAQPSSAMADGAGEAPSCGAAAGHDASNGHHPASNSSSAASDVPQLCRHKGFVGTIKYMAPEVFANSGEGFDGKAADMWSLGIILFEIVMGRSPIQHPHTSDQCFGYIIRGRLRDVLKAWGIDFEPLLLDLMQGLLSPVRDAMPSGIAPSPHQIYRLTLEEVIRHPWLTFTEAGSMDATD